MGLVHVLTVLEMLGLWLATHARLPPDNPLSRPTACVPSPPWVRDEQAPLCVPLCMVGIVAYKLVSSCVMPREQLGAADGWSCALLTPQKKCSSSFESERG